MELRKKDKTLIIDSGMELIWLLEDAYEQKNIGKFLSMVSFDFKKDFLGLKAQLEKYFSESEQLKLYILLIAKDSGLDKNTCSYDFCWSKRIKRQGNDYWQREFGRVTIVLRKYIFNFKDNLLVYDIYGDNPFCSI